MNQYDMRITTPKTAGWWLLPGSGTGFGIKFGATKKPNWFHRKMMLCLLGFKWEDEQ